MEWLKTLLKAAGLDDAAIDKLIADVNKELPNHLIPKDKYNAVSEAKKQAEAALADRDKQLEDLKKSSGDAETLKQQIDKLQADNKTAKEQYETKVKDLQLTTAIKLALAGKVHDPDIVAGQLDKTKIELDDSGAIKGGLDDQIKALQTSKAFLFVPEDKGGSQFQFKGAKPPEGGGAGGGGGGTDKAEEFGKKLAEFAKQNSSTAEAQKSYFG